MDLKQMNIFESVKLNNTNKTQKGKQKPFGIDLGTTNSAISVGLQSSSSKIITLKNGKNTMPSVVQWNGDNNFVVGEEAYNHDIDDSIVTSVKRLMQTNGATVTFKKDGQEKIMTPAEVSAEILKGLVAQTDDIYGEIHDVVVTVPAYFNQIGVMNTLKACELAGLNCLNILREPTAAALCYGLDRDEVKTDYAVVFDLGGGTFDVSLVKISDRSEINELCELYGIEVDKSDKSTNKIVEPLYIDGDGNLGGDDYDFELYHVLLERIGEVCTTANIQWDKDCVTPNEERRMIRVMSQLKRSLDNRQISLPITDKNGEKHKIDLNFYTEDFYRAFTPIYNRTRAKLNNVLQNAGVPVNIIVLMGGSTKNPILTEFLERDYPSYVISSALDPDESVALGAGIKAKNYLYGKESVQIFDILPQNIGILSDGKIDALLTHNSQLPCVSRRVFTTSHDNQEFVDIILYQGNSSIKDECVPIGKLRIDGITPKPKGEPVLNITLTVNSDSVLTCYSNIDGIEKSIEIDLGAVKTDTITGDKYLNRWKKLAETFEGNKKTEFEELLKDYPTHNSKKDIINWLKNNS